MKVSVGEKVSLDAAVEPDGSEGIGRPTAVMVGVALAMSGVVAEARDRREVVAVPHVQRVAMGHQGHYSATPGCGHHEKWVTVSEPARAMGLFFGRALNLPVKAQPWVVGGNGPIDVAALPGALLPEFKSAMDRQFRNPMKSIEWRVMKSFDDLEQSRVEVDRMVRATDVLGHPEVFLPKVMEVDGVSCAVLPESHQGVPLSLDPKHRESLIREVDRRGGWAAIPEAQKNALGADLWEAHVKYPDRPYRAVLEVEGMGWFADSMKMTGAECRDFSGMLQVARTMVMQYPSDRDRLSRDDGSPTAFGLAVLFWSFRKGEVGGAREALDVAVSNLDASGHEDVASWVNEPPHPTHTP